MGVASDTLASISRAQWEDYKARYLPLESQLMAGYKNPWEQQSAINESVSLSQGAFDAATATKQRELSRMGIGSGNLQGLQRRQEIDKTAATVDAMNTARQHIVDRDKMLLSGGLTTRGV